MEGFLPVSRADMDARGWDQCDFVYVIGDAYVDHPTFGHAIISRILEAHGFKVGIIPQPDWKDPDSIKVLGTPRLGFLVMGGNMDPMVNHYTVAKRRRSYDYFSPGGKMGLRPDYATTVYCNLIRRSYQHTPIIVGGIEASLRRLAHYDYWSDKLKRSLLLDSQADLLLYGMGERSIVEVAEALDSVDELESVLDQSKESMYKLSYVVRVTAPDLEELKRRCNEVKDFYDDLNVKLVRPFGDMLGLHGEFLPASKRYLNDYIQYVTSDFLAGLGFGATQMLGEPEGIYIGYSLDTGRNVYLKPALASQGVKGSVTNALAAAFVGSLGGGKSFSNNMIVYYSVLFGAQALIVDPKAERGRWKETLPEIAHEINIVNLTSEEQNRGLLDPYVIMENPKDSESLAIDILTFLTGISSRDGEKFPVLRKAIRAVTNSEERGLFKVIEELRAEGTTISTSIADHIESFTDYDFAHLLFSDGDVTQSISLEKQLNIIQVADLVLPDKETSFEEYTTMELLSVAMLIVISTFALDFIHTDRSVFKIVDLDEAWSFLQVAQGKTLSMKLVRAGRAMNAGVYFVTQNTDDLLDEKLKNNLGLKFAFRSTDINEIKKTLAFFGVDSEDENNQKRLRDLENGQCLISDLYGRVGVIQFHPIFEDLFHAFDTRPPVRKEVE